MTESIYVLLGSAATDLGCEYGELTSRLAEPNGFGGWKRLPGEVIESSPVLSVESGAVAVLCGRLLEDRNESLRE